MYADELADSYIPTITRPGGSAMTVYPFIFTVCLSWSVNPNRRTAAAAGAATDGILGFISSSLCPPPSFSCSGNTVYTVYCWSRTKIPLLSNVHLAEIADTYKGGVKHPVFKIGRFTYFTVYFLHGKFLFWMHNGV